MIVKASCNWKEHPNDPRIFIELDPDTPEAAAHFDAFVCDKQPGFFYFKSEDGHVKIGIGFYPPQRPQPPQEQKEDGDESNSAA